MARFYPAGGAGGGVSSDELVATAAHVLSGHSYVGNDTNDEIGVGTMPNYGGQSKGTDSVYISDDYMHATVKYPGYYDGSSTIQMGKTNFGTATQAQVLKDQTFTSSNGIKLAGTMPNNGAVAPSALGAGGSYTIPAGYHNGSGVVTVQSLATLTASGDATAAQILSGKKAYVDGSLITGSMTDRGAQTKTITPSASAQSYTIPAGYHNGSGKVSVPAVSNLTAANIKKGVVVGGVTGTWSGYVPTATDLYLRGNNIKGWTNVNGCVFQSGCIEASTCGYNGGFKTESHIDLSPYSKLNVEYLMTFTNFYHNNAMIQINTTANVYYTDKYMSIPNNQLNTTLTVSFDISTINMTAGKIRITFIGGDTTDKAKTNNSGPLIQVYRVWLS